MAPTKTIKKESAICQNCQGPIHHVIAQFGRCLNCGASYTFVPWHGEFYLHEVSLPHAVSLIAAVMDSEEGPTRAEIFKAGVEARRARGGNFNEYDLVLHGLGAVLRDSDLEANNRTWEEALSFWFHWPLAAPGMLDEGLEGIVEEMVQALKERDQPHKAKRVLRGQPRWIFTRSVADEDLEDHIVELEKSMAGGGDQRIDIANTRGWGHGILRRLEIIESLGGDIGDLEKLRGKGKEAIGAAERIETRCKQRITKLKKRLGNLPATRARALKPLSTLPTSVVWGWGHTATPEDADLICDGVAVLKADALYASRRRDLYERTGDGPPDEDRQAEAQGAAHTYWQKAQSETETEPVAAIGWRDNWLSGAGDAIGYAITEEGAVHMVSPHRAACIDKWTQQSLGALSLHIASSGQVLFYRGDHLVALMAPLHVPDDSPLRDIDIEEAKRTLADAT